VEAHTRSNQAAIASGALFVFALTIVIALTELSPDTNQIRHSIHVDPFHPRNYSGGGDAGN
jgi:hypothetical protein